MTNFLPAMRFVLFFLFSSYGLGRLVDKLVRNETKIGWAYATSLGVASWIVCGGVLNLLQMVSPLTLRCSLYAGATFALGFVCLDLFSRREKGEVNTTATTANGTHPPRHQKIADIAFFSLVMAVLIFCVYFLMPSNAFNFHDDFHYYLHPSLQLLSTGSLNFNLLSALGINEMGGQIFMKAFPAIYFDSKYANTFDSIICFALSLGLIIEFGRKIGAVNWITILSSIIFLLVNPQIVNTTSCYSGVLMIIGIIYTNYSIKKNIIRIENTSYSNILCASIPAAIFYSSLVTIKATLIIYSCSFFIFNFLFDILFQKSKSTVIKIYVSIGTVSLLLLSTWLFAPSTKYLHILQKKVISLWMSMQLNAPPAIEIPAAPVNGFRSLFSTGKLYWGNSYPDYMLILVALLVAAGFSLYGLSQKRFAKDSKEIVLVPAAALSASVCLFIFGRMIDIETALRYAIPILIAILPVSILFVEKYFRNSSHTLIKNCGHALLALYLLIGVMFTGTFVDRVKRISQQRTLISFPMSNQYRDFMRYIFSGQREEEVRSVQSTIKAGEPFLAWISTPFFLDFSRNRIVTLEVCDTLGGVYNDEIPSDVDIETFWNFFRKLGVRYILWEYNGAAVKDDQWYIKYGARKQLFFKKTLPTLARYTKVIYDNNSFAVLDIREFHVNTSNTTSEN